MSRGTQTYRRNEVKRAVRALQEAGVKIASVAFEDGRFEIVTAEDSKPKAGNETPEDVKKLL
jgi:hypothetical protein